MSVMKQARIMAAAGLFFYIPGLVAITFGCEDAISAYFVFVALIIGTCLLGISFAGALFACPKCDRPFFTKSKNGKDLLMVVRLFIVDKCVNCAQKASNLCVDVQRHGDQSNSHSG